jgi:hypothetical protein
MRCSRLVHAELGVQRLHNGQTHMQTCAAAAAAAGEGGIERQSIHECALVGDFALLDN